MEGALPSDPRQESSRYRPALPRNRRRSRPAPAVAGIRRGCPRQRGSSRTCVLRGGRAWVCQGSYAARRPREDRKVSGEIRDLPPEMKSKRKRNPEFRIQKEVPFHSEFWIPDSEF